MLTADGHSVGAERAAHLVDVVRRLAAARTLDQIVDVVRRAARALTGADGATFVLRRGDFCHYVDEDAISPLWKGRSFPLESCISGWAMLNRSAVAIEDIYSDERIPHDAYRPTFVRSLVMVPIRTEEPVGAIGNYWASRRRPAPDEIEVLQALADSTAVAMENVQVYAELEARVEERTAELARANDELREFTAAVAHDIRSPLTSVTGFADLLATHYAADMTPDAREAAETVQRTARNLSRFVTELLGYMSAGHRELEMETVVVPELVDEVCARLAGDIDERGAEVGVAGRRALQADRTLLSHALQNLVSNAVAYAPPDRVPVVTVELAATDGHWDLSVSDNGDGIPPEEREAVLTPFRRGSTGGRRSGSGLGLAVCRRVAEKHGGRLVIDDGPTGGASIHLLLPRPQGGPPDV